MRVGDPVEASVTTTTVGHRTRQPASSASSRSYRAIPQGCAGPARQAHEQPLPRPHGHRRTRARHLGAHRRRLRRPRDPHRRRPGHVHLRGPRRRHPAARADPPRRAAAAHHHPRRRGHRAGHRVGVVAQRAAARVGARDGRAHRLRRGRHGRPHDRHPDLFRGVPQQLRHPRLRHPAAHRARAGRAHGLAAARPLPRPRRPRRGDRRASSSGGPASESTSTTSTASCSSPPSPTSSSAAAPTSPAPRATTPAGRSSTAPSSTTARARARDTLSTLDYLWRWDTDWFWCSRAFGAQNPRVRRLWPKRWLRTSVYWKLIALDRRFDVADRLEARKGRPPRERVVQDVEIPLASDRRVPPLVPARGPHRADLAVPVAASRRPNRGPSTRCEPGETYVNVGFWSSVPATRRCPRGARTAASRTRSAAPRRPQVPVLGGLLRRGDLLAPLRRRRPTRRSRSATTPAADCPTCTPRPSAVPDRTVHRETPEEHVHASPRSSSPSSTGPCPCASRPTTAPALGPARRRAPAELATPRGVAYLATAPGDLGLARAYVTGDVARRRRPPRGPLRPPRRPRRTSATAARTGEHVSSCPGCSASRASPRRRPRPRRACRAGAGVAEGLRHSLTRDAEAIHHHYDVSNRFYEMVLGPSMAYTCAVYPSPDATLEQAQENKFRLVFDKLASRPGTGCSTSAAGGAGWSATPRGAGSASSAPRSRASRPCGRRRPIAEEGLSDLAEVRHSDYRDITETGFDAVSSIGLTEHIGIRNYPAYFGFIQDRLRPGGMLLNHCITRPHNRPHEHRGLHRPVRLPRRRADRLRADHHRRPGRGARGAARGEPPASTTR